MSIYIYIIADINKFCNQQKKDFSDILYNIKFYYTLCYWMAMSKIQSLWKSGFEYITTSIRDLSLLKKNPFTTDTADFIDKYSSKQSWNSI